MVYENQNAVSSMPPHEPHGFLARCRRACGRWSVERLLGVIVLLLILGGLVTFGASYGVLPAADFPMTSGEQWQAVFLVNNQVYFGHLKNLNAGYVTLDDVYYLQVSQLQPPAAQPQLNLIKLGSELHGPMDRMFIPKERILFWEEMKSDSQVVQAIASTRR